MPFRSVIKSSLLSMHGSPNVVLPDSSMNRMSLDQTMVGFIRKFYCTRSVHATSIWISKAVSYTRLDCWLPNQVPSVSSYGAYRTAKYVGIVGDCLINGLVTLLMEE